MKSLKVQVVEFFLDHLIRQNHEIEKDISTKVDHPNVIQMYSIQNYSSIFEEQIKLGEDIGLASRDSISLQQLLKLDSDHHFREFNQMGLGTLIARLQFGNVSDLMPAPPVYSLFHYKSHFFVSLSGFTNTMLYRLSAATELATPFFLDFCLRTTFGENGPEYDRILPLQLETDDITRTELSRIFSSYMLSGSLSADEMANAVEIFASNTDFQLFERRLRMFRKLYKDAGEDAFTLLKMVVPDPDLITFSFHKNQLATWIESVEELRRFQILEYLFVVLSPKL
ncbi:MAG: hypothetical protein LAT67_13690 [Balneolales bacterium]|nr:hypothetical protein [Balneolales bacterium]